jgi:DNA-binding PadR family transcriptional regulator
MGEKSGREQAFLPLTEASYCIMAALGEPRHGYGIMQAVAETSGGTVRLGPGTLYGALTKMLVRP